MASKIVLFLLLLGLTLKDGETSSICKGYATVIGRINELPPNQSECPTNSTAGHPQNLAAIIRVIVNGDVNRYHTVLNMARNIERRSIKMEDAIYEALCLVAKKTISDPIKILDFYNQIDDKYYISPYRFYRVFVKRSAKVLSQAVTNNSYTKFWMITGLLRRLTESEQYYTKEILEALFDIVLSSESPLNVVQRLSFFGASSEQLTMAHLQLLNRPEVQSNSSAHAELLDNLRQLMIKPAYQRSVDFRLRRKVYRLFPHYIDWVSTSFMASLRRANIDIEDYLVSCRKQDGTLTICTHDVAPWNENSVDYIIEVAHNKTLVALRFNFFNCAAVNSTIPISTRVTKNFYVSHDYYWWRVVLVPNGLALFDDATSSLVLCGGDSVQWDGDKHYAYARRAEDFEAHRDECTWLFENYE
ncbi:uncharacterized protein LOC132788177 [Drosophila nasuta]|uniref:uncharacterized protein LOC132788177 n=1 Tax=Drosophila nasuta TaxID=42062 RepID=UPI00295E4ECE|nr:uncharacterized protein LOC132788177 [Drosophila nasuta]